MKLIDSWNKIKVTEADQLKKLFEQDNPIDFAIDTETDGVFLMTSKPFLVVFGWTPKLHVTKNSTVVVFEPTPELMQTMYDLCGTLNIGFMHNAKFDLHMLHNVYKPYPHRNIIDTMSIARLILEAKPVDAGGPALALKRLADKYIEKDSSNEQKLIKQIKGQIQRQQLKEWEAMIATAGVTNLKKWSKPVMEKLEEDPLIDLQAYLPSFLFSLWKEFTANHPAAHGMKKAERVSYKDIYNFNDDSKQAMINYAFNDVIYTLALARKFMPYIIESKQLDILLEEQKTMFALYESERIGISIDWGYINESKERMKNHITTVRASLQTCLGEEYDAVTFAGSPQQIKKWLISMDYSDDISTSKASLEEILTELQDMDQYDDDESELIRSVLSGVLEHRALIKKYSTDLLGFERNAYNGKRYTVFNQNGAVTGRLSNDMQQMPNVGITDYEGNELFHPRKAVIPSSKEGYPLIAYLDYSQVEVRLQAHYSWIAMDKLGDQNMLRMFVPFNCYAVIEGVKTNWDPENRSHVNEEFIETNNWIQSEDDQPWEITDFHLLTARMAFPELKGLPKEDKLVQKRRKQAKNVNFAIQYGAGKAKVLDMVGDVDEGTKLYNGNKAAFQGLVAYAEMVKKLYYKNKYAENAYGRKYILKYYSHKLSNYVIQGTGAQILKQKIWQTADYLKDKKSRLIHNIHDELQFEIAEGEEHIIQELKAIMEDTGDMFIVPIVADVETTRTNWEEKENGIC